MIFCIQSKAIVAAVGKCTAVWTEDGSCLTKTIFSLFAVLILCDLEGFGHFASYVQSEMSKNLLGHTVKFM